MKRAVLWVNRPLAGDGTGRRLRSPAVTGYLLDVDAPAPSNPDIFDLWTSTGWRIAATHPATTEPDCTCIMLERES